MFSPFTCLHCLSASCLDRKNHTKAWEYTFFVRISADAFANELFQSHSLSAC